MSTPTTEPDAMARVGLARPSDGDSAQKQRPLRMLLISGDYFPPQVGGISTLMAELCRHLGPDRIAVLTGVGSGGEPDRMDGVRVYRAGGHMPPRGLSATAHFVATAARAFARERPDAMLFATLEDAYLAYWFHRLFRLPYVFYAHGNEVLTLTRTEWSRPRQALSTAAGVIAVSRYTRNLLTSVGAASDRVEVIHPGCDLEHFKPMHVSDIERHRLTGARPYQRIILTVGNLVERKGHDMVIRALAALGDQAASVLYLVAGDGPNRQALTRLTSELGLTERILFLGRVPDQDLPALYTLADIFVMPSRLREDADDVEGFGIVYMEAAACGTPSIAGNVGGATDAVIHEETGLLVDPEDVTSLAAALARLLADTGLAARLGEAARRRAVEVFGWSRVAAQVSAFTRRVLPSRMLAVHESR